MIVIGNTKNPDGPVLAYSHDKWKAFVERVRQGNVEDIA